MSRNIILISLIVICMVITPIMGISTSSVYASGGSMTYSHAVSMERGDNGLNWPAFGANNTGNPYTYDGSQSSILTLGRSSVTRNTKIDPHTSNFYAAQTTVSGTYMINAEDTAGMLNIQPNEPSNMCDAEGFLMGDGSTGAYPVSESYEGRVGVIIHGGGVYESEVGLNDGNVHLSGAADIVEKGYLYQNVHAMAKKGFDKNASTLNAVIDEKLNGIARTAVNGEEHETHAQFVHDYDSFSNAYNELIEDINKKTDTITEISSNRVNETVEDPELINQSINQTVNQSNQTND